MRQSVDGMTPAAARVQARAVELLADGHLGLASEKQPRGVVLVGIARPGASVVLELPAAEYDGMELARLAGFTFPIAAEPERSAMERALEKMTQASGRAPRRG